MIDCSIMKQVLLRGLSVLKATHSTIQTKLIKNQLFCHQAMSASGCPVFLTFSVVLACSVAASPSGDCCQSSLLPVALPAPVTSAGSCYQTTSAVPHQLLPDNSSCTTSWYHLFWVSWLLAFFLLRLDSYWDTPCQLIHVDAGVIWKRADQPLHCCRMAFISENKSCLFCFCRGI